VCSTPGLLPGGAVMAAAQAAAAWLATAPLLAENADGAHRRWTSVRFCDSPPGCRQRDAPHGSLPGCRQQELCAQCRHTAVQLEEAPGRHRLAFQLAATACPVSHWWTLPAGVHIHS
jgi:hypothetical protein